MHDLMSIAIKLVTAFAGLWAMTRLLGKKEIAQLTPFDFISAMVLGDLVGNTIYDGKVTTGMLIFALTVWTVLSYLFEKITQYGKPLRKPLEGKPELLIVNGQIDLAAMRRNSLDFDQLRMMLRQRDVFSISEVAYAVYETNGALSILKKSAYQALQRGDVDMEPSPVDLPRSLVEDGILQPEGLNAIGHDETWLRQQLRALGYTDIRSVAYAECNEEGEVLAIPRFTDAAKRKLLSI